MICLYLKLAYKKDVERFFTRAWGNDFKLKEDRFRLDIQNTFFYYEGDETLEQVAQRSREAVDVQALEMFKVRLERSLSNLIE